MSLVGCSQSTNKNLVTLEKVIDGDTVTIIDADSQPQQVDLAYIDAPEPEQPFGRDSRKALSEFLTSKTLELKASTDGSVLVLADGESANEYMVREGFAWPKNTVTDPTIGHHYAGLKEQAVNKLTGIWSLEHALRVPPWTWREQAKELSPTMKAISYERMRQQQELQRRQAMQRQAEMQQRIRMQQQKKKDQEKN